MTTDELIAAARRHLREPSAEQWQNTTLVEYMNYAQRELGPELHIRAYATIATTTTDQSYSLATVTGLLELHEVYLDGTPLKPIPVNTSDKGYWRWKTAAGVDSIYLYALPSAAGTLKIWYWKAATDLSTATGGASPDFDSRWHHILVPYAVAMASFEAQNSEIGDGYMAMFDAQRQRMAVAWQFEFGGAAHKVNPDSSWKVN